MSEAQSTFLEQLDRLEDLILEGSSVPLTGCRLVNQQEAEDVIYGLRDATQIGRAHV